MWLIVLSGCATLDAFIASPRDRLEWLGVEDSGTSATPVDETDTGEGGLGPVEAFSVGAAATCLIEDGGGLRCFYGQSVSDEWVQSEPSGGPWSSVVVGFEHACAVRLNGSLDCWGRDFQFDAGDSSPDERFRAGPFDEVRLGVRMGCGAIEGTWSCWAYEAGWDEGQPVLENVRDLDVWNGACAILPSGTVCWGMAENPSFDGIDAVQVRLGPAMACVRDSIGDVWCSGFEQARWTEPERVARTAEAMSRPEEQGSVCVLTDGDIDCFGSVGFAVEDSGTPLPVLGSFVEVGASRNFACGRTRGGTLECFGRTSDARMPR